jgi:TonB-linked SusC/RagA family outer membrane protein
MLAVLILYSVLANAQSKNVTGKITDAQGQPVPFATIKVQGSKGGTSADADGLFTIKAKSGDVLIVTGSGFAAKEAPVGTGFITVQVTRKESNLTEIVVTALGINKQQKALGYSTAKISGKDLTTAQPINLTNGLTGKVAGLEINTVNNGLFAPTRVTLRGNRSLIGNNQPLTVVDGAIFYNDISTINAQDIESINILKGASASAIYGSDASNGVMIITTKHGSNAKPTVTFSTTTQMEKVAYLPSYQSEFGNNGGEYYVYNYNDLSTYIPFENQSYGPMFNGALVPSGRLLADGSVKMIPYSAVKNQKRDFFNTGITEQNSMSFSGGDDRGRFYVSAQDIASKNPMPGDNGRRDVIRVGGAKNYGPFSADFSVSYTYTDKNTTNTGAVYDMVLNTPAEIPLSSLRDWQTNKNASLDGYFNDYFYNPYWIAANQRNLTRDNTLQGNVHLGLKPTKWLNFSYRLSANYTGEKYEYKQAEADYSPFSLSNDTVYFSNPSGTGTVVNTNFGSKWIATNNGYTQPSYNTYNSSNFLITSDFVATATTKWKDFDLNGSVGTSYIDNQINYLDVNANNIFFPVYNVSSLTGIPTVGQFFGEARKLGYFGDGQIGYGGFAYLHGSFRTDEDSRLSKSNRWIPYYDVDASVVLSELIPIIKNGKYLDYLKVRGAVSKTGNATALAAGQPYLAAGAYQTTPTLNSVSGFPFSGLGGFQLTQNVANPNIKPEKVNEKEIGIELGFLKDRISLNADYYDQKLKDGIVKASLPYSSGYATALLNAANTDNKGYEIELKGDVIRNKDWTWNVKANYSFNETKVLSINGGLQSLNIGSASGAGFTGQTIANNGYSYAVLGQLYPVIEATDWARDPSGHVIVSATTGLPSIDPNLKVLGNANPKYIMGLSTTVAWKRLSLTVTGDYRGGYKTFNSIGQFMAFTGVSSYTTQTNRQRFVFPNSVILDPGGSGKYITNTSTEVNDANFNLFPGLFNQVGSPWVESAAAWKIREVAVSYNIPVTAFGNQQLVKNAVLTVSARNLFMFRPKTNLWTDPEFGEDTSNAVGENSINQAPPTRIFGATLAVTF